MFHILQNEELLRADLFAQKQVLAEQKRSYGPEHPKVKSQAARVEQFERAYLQQQLLLCGGKVGQLAKRVGMERTHLYRKLRSLGVDFRNMSED